MSSAEFDHVSFCSRYLVQFCWHVSLCAASKLLGAEPYLVTICILLSLSQVPPLRHRQFYHAHMQAFTPLHHYTITCPTCQCHPCAPASLDSKPQPVSPLTTFPVSPKTAEFLSHIPHSGQSYPSPIPVSPLQTWKKSQYFREQNLFSWQISAKKVEKT